MAGEGPEYRSGGWRQAQGRMIMNLEKVYGQGRVDRRKRRNALEIRA
jgi:hypothetical protein